MTEFEHYNVKNENCKAIQYFGVKQIPLCVLIDKQGKIAFLGHPTWRRIDEDINQLVKGKKLAGRGTETLESMREKQWGTEGLVDQKDVETVTKSFMNQCNALVAKHDVETTAVSMKQCVVQLLHKVKVNL